jgi:hypothetical protein
MPSKIIWLAMLFTLVYWLGSAGGCASKGDNQNYEILNDDRPMFDTRHDTDKPGALIGPETAPSVNGLDRSHWATIQTRPADGSTPYPPRFGQVRIASGWDGSDQAVAADSSDVTPPDEPTPADAGS